MLNLDNYVTTVCNSKTRDYYAERGYVYTKHNDKINVKIRDLLESSTARVNPICDYCGEKYETTYEIYNKGRKAYPKDCCSKCAGKKASEVSLAKRAKTAFDKLRKVCLEKKYILLTDESEYTGMKMKIKYICPIHGEMEGILYNIIKGNCCKKCGREIYKEKVRISSDEVEKIVNSINGNVLLNKEDYTDVFNYNLKIRCKCGNDFITSLSAYKKSTQQCKTCSQKESTGEKLIKNILEKNSIKYEQEKRFCDCRDVKPLPFDFYLPDYNQIIEFDGQGHFEEIKRFNYPSKKFSTGLEQTQYHDKIKNEYCKKNNISLLRIPYWESENAEHLIMSVINKIA